MSTPPVARIHRPGSDALSARIAGGEGGDPGVRAGEGEVGYGRPCLSRRRLRGGDYSRSRRTRSMKPSVAAERSSARQARLSGTFRAGRPFSGR